MSDYLPHWPHDSQDLIDRMAPNHWFAANYHRVNRTPTRAELFNPYIPADILDDGPQEQDPRLREALAYFIREAEEEAARQAQDLSASENESTDMEIDHPDDMTIISLSDEENEGEHVSL